MLPSITTEWPPRLVRRLLPAAFLILITVLAYLPVLRHGVFVWDDRDNVSASPLLRSASGLHDIWTKFGQDQGGAMQYYPLTYTSFWLEYHAWGLRPEGYHATNVVLHVLNAVLIWIILLRLRVPGALLAAAIFAVHPVHVESVAWITERKNVLSGLFYLLSLLAFIRFFGLELAQEGGKPVSNPGRRRDYYLGLALFVLALASKTATATLPPTLLMLIWWRTGRIGWRNMRLTAPMFLLTAGWGLLTFYVEKYHAGAMGPEWSITAADRILLAGRALCFYAGKLLWPHPLMTIYPRWEISQADWRQYLFPLSALAAIAALWAFRKRAGRGPLTAALFFAGTLAPVLGFMDAYFMRFSYVTDHFLYLPSLGPIALLSAGVFSKYQSLVSRVNGKAIALAALALLAALGSLTYTQSGAYTSPDRIWSDNVKHNPDAWLARYNLGVLLADSGKKKEAVEQYREALRIKPDYHEAHNNLGVLLGGLGKTDEAIAHFREAARLNPLYTDAYNNLGSILAEHGRMKEAAAQYRKALEIRPNNPVIHANFVRALLELGRREEAVAQYREVLRLRPDDSAARNDLALLLAGLGRREEAVTEYLELLRITPDYQPVYYDINMILAVEAVPAIQSSRHPPHAAEKSGVRQ